jgi:hypothetical protein
MPPVLVPPKLAAGQAGCAASGSRCAVGQGDCNWGGGGVVRKTCRRRPSQALMPVAGGLCGGYCACGPEKPPASENNRRSHDPGRHPTRRDSSPHVRGQLLPTQPTNPAAGSVLRSAPVQRVTARACWAGCLASGCAAVHPACQGTLPGAGADPDVGAASRRSAAALSEWPRSATQVTVTLYCVPRSTPSLWPVLQLYACVLNARRADLPPQ